jgi:hypothetical protein
LDRDHFDVIVVGAGTGGLTAGALLTRFGKSVLVLDRHYIAGGNATVFRRRDYEFDVGIHYVGNCGPEGSVPLILRAAGFVLGTIPVLWLVPIVGARTAELLEAPVMLAVVIFTARWVVRHYGEERGSLTSWLGVGGLALILALLFDFTVILRIRGLSFTQYVEAFDPIAGTAYDVMLGLFALMPMLVSRTQY